MYEIQEKHKIYMKKVLEPSDEMKGIINARMQELNITFKQYIVIHVRCGDSYLKQEKI
jgi:hemerythrin